MSFGRKWRRLGSLFECCGLWEKTGSRGRDWAGWGEGPELAGGEKVLKRVALMELDDGVRATQPS